MAYFINLFRLILDIHRLVGLDPSAAAVEAATFLGEPHLAKELQSICARESKCTAVSIHANDSHAAKSMYKKAVMVGWLKPSTCEHHRLNASGEVERFGVRGAYGTSAAYTLWHLGACLPPEILDIPYFAAVAAIKRMMYQCERYGACTKGTRRRMWAGAARFDRRLNEDGC